MRDEIKLPEFLTKNNFDSLLLQVTDEYLKYTKKVKFDFTTLKYMSAFAMVSFLLLCWHIHEAHGKSIFIRLGNSYRLSSCIHILSRFGFFHQMPDNLTYYPFAPKQGGKKFGSNRSILEISRVDQDIHPQPLVKLAKEAIEANTHYDSRDVFDICSMISELLQNIVDHSEVNMPGFIVIQNQPQKSQMQLVISDIGEGIPNSIRSISDTYTDLSDTDAILTSLQDGISRFPGEDRGEGLAETLKLAKKHSAKLYLRSNAGSVELNPGIGEEAISEKVTFSGTQVLVQFPVKENLA